MTITLTKGATVRVVPTGQGPVPESLVGNPGSFTQEAGQTSASWAGQVTFMFGEPHDTGRYADGTLWVWNPPHQDGFSWTDSTPAGEAVSTYIPAHINGGDENYNRDMHGAMINPGLGAPAVSPTQGLDGFRRHSDGTSWYDPALNIDPGKTGVPFTLAPGQEGTILKAVSTTTPPTNARPALNTLATLHVVRTKPTVGSFAPGAAIASKRSKWNEADIDWDKLPNIPQSSVSSFPTLSAERTRHARWPLNVFATDRPEGDKVSPAFAQDNYASYAARQWTDVMLMSLFDINEGDRRLIVTGLIRHGIDVWERLQAGGRYYEAGLGGVFAGFKMPVAYAAWLLDDAAMIDWLATTRNSHATARFPEDVQYTYITETGNDDYISIDIGMPEWQENPFHPTPGEGGKQRAAGKTYRDIERAHGCQQELALHLLPGLRAIYNPHPAMLDYADRIYERDFFKGAAAGSTFKWGFNSGTNRPEAFVQSCWENLRSTGDLPIWDWPA
jgi:hypothetical protein